MDISKEIQLAVKQLNENLGTTVAIPIRYSWMVSLVTLQSPGSMHSARQWLHKLSRMLCPTQMWMRSAWLIK